ncbi:hypothetical protein C3492_35960 [Streptomyces sp. Ru62]|uniref:hypothetical protein n=1 Tax=Streptomyces sp. Ru62 TaxID=2080745 RepID=UPI000CDD934B|nr:hypothetical protein [Streptomyces sp. Ru62]POX58774.1 hypothetical protein C3492_35960 [Streptomyces sp. Ru62]
MARLIADTVPLRDGGGHDLVVQTGVAAAAAKDEGEVAAGAGKQVPAVEAAAVVHHEHGRGDVDGRQGDVNHGGDPGPDRGSRGAGVLEGGAAGQRLMRTVIGDSSLKSADETALTRTLEQLFTVLVHP